jgi:hypothetical protein
MNLGATKRVGAHRVDQRVEQPCQTAQPVAHGARFDLDAVARVHDGLAIERDVVRELRCCDVGEQSRTRQPRSIGRLGAVACTIQSQHEQANLGRR